jgi:hypothetical protein
LLLLALALADNALVGLDSEDDFWALQIPDGDDQLILPWHDSALEQPILRTVHPEAGVTAESWKAHQFRRIFKALLAREGYTCGASIHMIRRYLGKKVDGK